MKKWARLDEENIVTEIIVESDEEDLEGRLANKTPLGLSHHEKNDLVRTFDPESGVLGGYAAEGFRYDPELMGFVPPQPDPTDIFDAKTFEWLPKKPDEEKEYYWNKEEGRWVAVD